MTSHSSQSRRTHFRRPSALGTRQSALSSRALTLVEVLLAVALLALTMAVVMSAVSAIAGMEGNGRKRLQAFEVANRIMLQYLDDSKKMPDKSLAISYGDNKFYWDLDETPAIMRINQKQEGGGANLQALDRFKLVVVTVYESDSDGMHETVGEPLALLSRAIDPYAPRNPDSLETFSSDPSKITDMVRSLVGGGGGGSGTTSRVQGSQLK